MFSYNDDHSPEENTAMALYEIASQLNNLMRVQTMDLVANDIKEGASLVASGLGELAEAVNQVGGVESKIVLVKRQADTPESKTVRVQVEKQDSVPKSVVWVDTYDPETSG